VPTLNLGILAHVDAGKTTLTERLLFAAGVIDEIGSVDAGSTRTDSLPLERRRGITIKSAVASFAVGGVSVNLIDTPGHPDFIAEVERALRVLDGAVLVVSAVEGVQAQTRVLLRTLRRLRVPTLLFVNKIDRRGARYRTLLDEIAEKLTPDIVPMSSVRSPGTREARSLPLGPADPEFTARLLDLAADDEGLLAAYVRDEASLPYPRLRRELAERARRGLVHPVFFGSAATGEGVDQLMAALTELLPVAAGDRDGPVSGSVFKVEADRDGARIAYVRVFSGTVRTRDRLPFGPGGPGGPGEPGEPGETGEASGQDGRGRQRREGRVTAIDLVEGSTDVRRALVAAGEIGKLRGLEGIRIGDAVGVPPDAPGGRHLFAPPTLEAVVVPGRPAERARLHAALRQLAEQDPLIGLRQDDLRQELSVSLYGEVQKEVIQATLAEEYGVEVGFRATTTVCAERPAGVGEAEELLGRAANPYLATLGLRVEPGPAGCGVAVRLDVPVESIPLYVYKTVGDFHSTLAEVVRGTLRQGLRGWQVRDCLVTVTRCGYSSPSTTAADFRKLAPLVLMTALKRAGTVVSEPVHRFRLDGPAEALGTVLGALGRFAAVADEQRLRRSSFTVSGTVPAARVRELEQAAPALAHGEGVLESAFDHYRPVRGTPPVRPRWDDNPLDRREYLLRVERRVAVRHEPG
jgi:ribosomal protection tetracycline resistance protein